MAGRRPKPTALKGIVGTIRPDRAREAEPEPPEGVIVMPEFLKYREKELWVQYEPILTAMGTLTVADVPNFAAWCVLMAEFESAKAKTKSSDIAQMRMLAAGLGMDASARAKLGTVSKPKKDPTRKYFKPKTNAV